MSPFRNESATLEEQQRRLGALARALEGEGRELLAARRRQRTPVLAFVAAAAVVALAFGVGDRVAALATEVRATGPFARLLVDHAHGLIEETTLGSECLLHESEDTRTLLLCQSPIGPGPGRGASR